MFGTGLRRWAMVGVMRTRPGVVRPEGDEASAKEFLEARDNCRKAYEADQDSKAAALDGIVGIYIRHFVDASGTPFPGTNGQGGWYPIGSGSGSSQPCAEPPVL